ncbi:hypothetical protein [Pedosphaera parvula]|uniref:Uncharacterized protein n=1 Tax=Pedosphaera parvula (strain Ellin514) TaxID=320771 RepID=B9XHX6_PEDPL|nr:hypothetical protein [Pedosphaera parvula]EEF60469.1 hypothetical protein Cflav_PD3439 [Pedosphaera parvula Ellin514]
MTIGRQFPKFCRRTIRTFSVILILLIAPADWEIRQEIVARTVISYGQLETVLDGGEGNKVLIFERCLRLPHLLAIISF